MNIFTRPAWNRGFEAGQQQGYTQGQAYMSQRREEIRRIELAGMIGSPVIVVPNEWSNPVVGLGKELMEVGMSTVLVVENFLTGEDVICGGVMMDYSKQKLEALLKLDPYERWAVLAVNSVGHETYDKPKSGQCWDKEQIIAKLEESGFFRRVSQLTAERAKPGQV